MNEILSIPVCRHYDVDWLAGDRCRCRECGKEGYWTSKGVSIWVRTEPKFATAELVSDSAASLPVPAFDGIVAGLAKVG